MSYWFRKHASHDQKDHGNWAHGGTGSSVDGSGTMWDDPHFGHFNKIATSAINALDSRLSRKNPNQYRLGHMYRAWDATVAKAREYMSEDPSMAVVDALSLAFQENWTAYRPNLTLAKNLGLSVAFDRGFWVSTGSALDAKIRLLKLRASTPKQGKLL